MQVDPDSSCHEASWSAYLGEIRRQPEIDANDELQLMLEHSTKLLHRAERMAKGDKELQLLLEHPTNFHHSDNGEQAAAALPPLAPIPPIDWR